ncbi:MAG: hypothetical protein AMJ55_08000 [Gammaproteobacteria bacterium SG8_15]|nr:MAG: hypothetical protein AMJ55_08000 [Gammaproteobacteria bacterium SG8_15]
MPSQHSCSVDNATTLLSRSAMMRAPGATPILDPPLPSPATVPATCVPWPCTSAGSLLPSPEKFQPTTSSI